MMILLVFFYIKLKIFGFLTKKQFNDVRLVFKELQLPFIHLFIFYYFLKFWLVNRESDQQMNELIN